jgi:hypothetical protein
LTKSTGVGRGGPRPNAGRKRIPGAVEIAAVEAEALGIVAAEIVGRIGSDEPFKASDLKGLALKALKQIIEASPSDSARVAAIKEAHSRIDKEEMAGTPEGKKAQAKQSAEALMSGGGKFSAPSSPPSLVSKTVQ